MKKIWLRLILVAILAAMVFAASARSEQHLIVKKRCYLHGASRGEILRVCVQRIRTQGRSYCSVWYIWTPARVMLDATDPTDPKAITGVTGAMGVTGSKGVTGLTPIPPPHILGGSLPCSLVKRV